MSKPTVTSNYAGKAAGFYISAALKEASSLDHLTVLQNIKFKTNLQKVAGANLVRNASCNFDDHGTLALTESILTPKNLQINMQTCKDQLLESWEAETMRAGAMNNNAPAFEDYVISYFTQHIADAVESSVWSGAAANNGEFEGFLTATTGAFAVNGNVIANAAAGAYTAGTIISELQKIAAAIPSTVYGKEDLRIYMNWKTYRLYVSAISALGYVNMYSMNNDYEATFEGIKLSVVYGMPDNQMVAAQVSNLYFGTDLLSDTTQVKMLDMSPLDGSENLRFVAKYSGGVQVGIGSEVVHQS
jgi:hypothetical protein|tara:strand:- start:1500 stop:2405 length:906 start_codon:yes stop_codon:yes gene_type:complete